MPQTQFVESILYNMIFNCSENQRTRITIQVNISANCEEALTTMLDLSVFELIKSIKNSSHWNDVRVYVFATKNWSATIAIIWKHHQQAISMPFSLLLVFHSLLWWSMVNPYRIHVFVNAVTYCDAFPFFSYFQPWISFAFRLLLSISILFYFFRFHLQSEINE